MKKPLSLSFEDTQHAFAYKSDNALRKSYRLFSIMHYGILVKIGSVLAPIALKLRLPIKGIIRNTIFEQFCGGETLKEAAETAVSLRKYGVNCTLDYGVEAAEGEEHYDLAVAEFQKAINYAANEPDIPLISFKVTGFARFKLLEKFDDEGKTFNEEEDKEWLRVVKRVKAVCRVAYEKKIGILIDAEVSWIQKAVDYISIQMMIQFNREDVIIFNTFQLYRHDRLAVLKEQWKHSREHNYFLGAKLVRGAYMEKERERAEEKGYPSPIQPDKTATDNDYNLAVNWCLEHLAVLSVFIGTHNEESCMLAAQYMHDHGIPHNHPHVHFSQLYGMSDNITFNLARAGYRVSKYLPYGPVNDVLPYLIRRSNENSSISGQMSRELLLLQKEIKRRKQKK